MDFGRFLGDEIGMVRSGKGVCATLFCLSLSFLWCENGVPCEWCVVYRPLFTLLSLIALVSSSLASRSLRLFNLRDAKRTK